ncbi:MAG: hypothetical protein R2747_14110 [Pyrinomonadaceae bacterium]
MKTAQIAHQIYESLPESKNHKPSNICSPKKANAFNARSPSKVPKHQIPADSRDRLIHSDKTCQTRNRDHFARFKNTGGHKKYSVQNLDRDIFRSKQSQKTVRIIHINVTLRL